MSTSITQDALPWGSDPALADQVPALAFQPPSEGPVRYTVIPSPVGEVLLLGDGAALTGLYLRWSQATTAGLRRDDGAFTTAAEQLRAYFAGELRTFDLPLAPRGSAFQMRVWQALTTIPYGRTASYKQIAERIGQPSSPRAVGLANGRNPISVVVPCHRVIGANGSLVGYGGGLDRKEKLLRLERGLPLG